MSGVPLVVGINASIDHRVPRAAGGTNNLSNLQWVDLSTNIAKSSRPEADFIAMCMAVVAYQASKKET